MKVRPRVYISGPITLGDREHNIKQAVDAAKQLLACGYAPMCPHLSCYYPFADELPHHVWIEADLPWVEMSDAVVRLAGESKGSDQEVEHARENHVPVFYSVAELVANDLNIVPLRVFMPGAEAVSRDGSNPKDLVGATKPNLALIPPAAMLHEAMAMGNGAEKYGSYNWRQKKVRAMIYIAAAQRHLASYLDGEEVASDSGVHHLGHARACLGILLDAMETCNLIDDRPLPGCASRLIERFTRRTIPSGDIA